MSQTNMSILSLKVLFFAMIIAAWQSQRIDTNDIGFIPNGVFTKKFFSYSASVLANSRAINSTP
ncbi:hypothetical protein MANES_05G145801v8 [Manihot esculenta]|uniref:Uncharacterized protein n=1 Tax=Manihot esculenta TaxID=3983 RepID=A0ACB7HR02_MANES|nr:hypothetical protein MANES_05G145801v8 [Manihot esculenta]